jgi:hypothetical protein
MMGVLSTLMSLASAASPGRRHPARTTRPLPSRYARARPQINRQRHRPSYRGLGTTRTPVVPRERALVNLCRLCKRNAGWLGRGRSFRAPNGRELLAITCEILSTGRVSRSRLRIDTRDMAVGNGPTRRTRHHLIEKTFQRHHHSRSRWLHGGGEISRFALREIPRRPSF